MSTGLSFRNVRSCSSHPDDALLALEADHSNAGVVVGRVDLADDAGVGELYGRQADVMRSAPILDLVLASRRLTLIEDVEGLLLDGLLAVDVDVVEATSGRLPDGYEKTGGVRSSGKDSGLGAPSRPTHRHRSCRTLRQ